MVLGGTSVPGSCSEGDSPMWSNDDDFDGPAMSLSDIFGSTPTSPVMKMIPSLFMFDHVGDGDGADLKCVPPSTLSPDDVDDDDVSTALPLEPQSLFSFTSIQTLVAQQSTATMDSEPTKQRGARIKAQSVTPGARNRLHACSWCPKSFSTTGHLKQHTRIHTGDRPFECTWCDKAFAQCGDLKRHVRIHTGEKPFECTSCGKAFAQCGNLKKHERIHVQGGDSVSPTPSDSSSDGSNGSIRPSKRIRTAAASPNEKFSSKPAPAPATPKATLDADDLDDLDDETDDSDESRQERSRRNARESRVRKKEYVITLETKLAEMGEQGEQLRYQLLETQLKLQKLQDEHNTLLEMVAGNTC